MDATENTGGWSGLLNISMPGAEGGTAMKAEIESARPNVYMMRGFGSRGKSSYAISSSLELGSLATGVWPNSWTSQGRALSSQDLPEPIRFAGSVMDLYGTDLDVSVSLGIHFMHGELVADASLLLNGEGVSVNATLEYGCMWSIDDESCHTPLHVDAVATPRNLDWCVPLLLLVQ